MRALMALSGATALALTIACGSSPSSPSGLNGSLNVRITDSPYSDAKALLVTFSSMAAHKSAGDLDEGTWITLPFAESATTRTCDLKKLANAEDALGVGALSAGHYTQLRFTVTSAVLYFDSASSGSACDPSIAPPAGRSAPVVVSSGEVKLNRPFDLAAGGSTTMLVDFDGDKSVIQMGNGDYRMTPVIGVVNVQ